jgi:hypothetical protein
VRVGLQHVRPEPDTTHEATNASEVVRLRHKGPERGEVSTRLVVAAAVVAGLVWVVPTVLFGREQADYVADLTGASTTEAETGARGSAPVDPIGRANDAQAQAALNSAVRIAQVFYAENGSYSGFGPEVAAQYDPTVAFSSGPAAPGVVSVRGLTPTTVVFVTETARGAYLCTAANEEVVAFGRADAQVPAQCSGGWA